MINPFPVPDRGSESTKMVYNWVKQMIESPKGLKFHDCLDKVKEFVESGNQEMAIIAGYYCVNILLKTNITDIEKTDIIFGLEEQIRTMKST